VLAQGHDAAAVEAACARIRGERVHEIAVIQQMQAVPPRIVLGRSWLAAAMRRLVPRLASTRLGGALLGRQMRLFAYGVDEVRLQV
jgi:hypothetical protein